MLYWMTVVALAYELIGLVVVLRVYGWDRRLKEEMDKTAAESKSAYIFCTMGTALFWPMFVYLWVSHHVQRFFWRRRLRAKMQQLRKRLNDLGLADADIMRALANVEQIAGLRK